MFWPTFKTRGSAIRSVRGIAIFERHVRYREMEKELTAVRANFLGTNHSNATNPC